MAGQAGAPRGGRALIVRPLVLFVLISGSVFALAQLHLAKPGLPPVTAGTKVALGDSRRGAVAFAQSCGGCHGVGGKGGGIGPRLVGASLSVAAVKRQIDAGGGAMPPALVKGATERDVLAYVATLIKAPPG